MNLINDYGGIPIFRTSKGIENSVVHKNQRVREIGLKLQRSTEERERLLVRVIGRFEKFRVRWKLGFQCYFIYTSRLGNNISDF